MSGASKKRSRGVSLRPSDATSDFDLLAVYANPFNQREVGTKWITLHRCPVYARQSFDRVRARAVTEPDIGALASIAVEAGLARIQIWPAFQDFAELKKRALLADLDAESADELYDFLGGFRFTLPDLNHCGFRKWSLLTPEPVRKQIAHSAGLLGISSSTLAVVALMEVLAEQKGVLSGHRDGMRDTVEAFHRCIKKRVRRCKLFGYRVE